jgi:isoleucyl-tRNA synthetase
MNKVLKDVINRYQVLQGRRVTYVPGWDCHGLPIENKALKALEAADDANASGESAGPRDFTNIPPAEIRAAAERLALESVDGQRKTFEQLGIMADWAGELAQTGDEGGGTYRTLDRSYVAAQLAILRQMVERGLVYGARRPTYYSPSSRTALAEAELKYVEDHVSESCWVRLAVPPAERGDALSKVLSAAGENETVEVGLVIWTTTAWTLGSNMVRSATSDGDACRPPR